MDKYEHYRKKYRTYIEDENARRSAELSEQRQADKARREAEKAASDTFSSRQPVVNRAKERKEIAKRKERIRFLEKAIAELEEEQKNLEASFGKDTTKEDYDRYAKNSEALEEMYSEYMELENN